MLLIYWKYEVNKLLQFRMITEIYICCNLWFSKFTPVEDEIYPWVKNPWSSLFDSILRAFKSVTVFPLDQESCFKVKIWIFLELLLVLWNRHFKYNGITLFWAYLICRTSLCVRIWRDVRYFALYRVLKALKNCRCGPISAWSSSSLIKSTLLLPNGYRPRPPKSMWGVTVSHPLRIYARNSGHRPNRAVNSVHRPNRAVPHSLVMTGRHFVVDFCTFP